jgi:hypothetical protein
LKLTIPTANILKVYIIMNNYLWQSFKIGIQQLKDRGTNENCKFLWHGTRHTNLKQLYEGEEGFDIKYSNDGMWGRGLYFAENASYNRGYSR